MDDFAHIKQREEERQEAAASIRQAIVELGKDGRELDAWERVHFIRALACIFRGAYSMAKAEAELSQTPEAGRSPQARLPIAPIYEKCTPSFLLDMLEIACSEPALPAPHFGPIAGGDPTS